MPTVENRNRIYVVLVICSAFVISIWLLQRTPNTKTAKNGLDTLSANTYQDIERNDDWKKILVSVDNGVTDTSLISKKDSMFITKEDSTLTDQMSRDFLAQYLLAVKNNGDVTSNEAEIIAQNTLALPEYTKSVGARYVSANLKIDSRVDIETLRIYRNRLYKILKDRSSQIKDDPIVIVINSLTSESDKDIAKLDYIISQNKGLLNDMLALQVPKNAVTIHLSLLNSASNVLANLEAMRLVLGDPVRGLAGIGEYSQNIMRLQDVLTKTTTYFTENL
jgi:hypothetical protein